MTAIPELYACGAILAERFDSISDWQRRLGTVSGSPGYCKSPLGGRGMIGGSGAVLSFANKNKTNYTAKSVVMWLTPAAFTGAYRILYDNGLGTSPYGDRIQTNNTTNTLILYVKNTSGTQVYGTFPYIANILTVIGYSYDGATVTYYSGGIQTDTPDALTGTISSSSSFQIGNVTYPLAATDKIYAIAIFDRALTAAEMLDLAKGQPFDRISRSLVSEWRPGAGPTIPDLGWKGLGNNGTATDVTAVQTPFGWGGRFNGSTSIIEMGVGTGLDLAASNFSIEAVVKGSPTTDIRSIVGKLDYTTHEYGLYSYNGSIRIQVRSDGVSNAVTFVYSPNRWYHIIGIRSNDMLYLYIDGVSTGTPVSVAGVSPATSGKTFKVGREQSLLNAYDSDIAYAAIYNEALTPLQVRHRYNSIMAGRF